MYHGDFSRQAMSSGCDLAMIAVWPGVSISCVAIDQWPIKICYRNTHNHHIYTTLMYMQ